jgi:hypothetical protein
VLSKFIRKFFYALSGDPPEGLNGMVRAGTQSTLLEGLPDPDPFPRELSPDDLDL